GPDIDRDVRSFQQAVSDIRTTVTWLRSRETVDSDKIAVLGISLGAILAHLAMAEDDRIGSGVAIVGGGNVADIVQRSTLLRLIRAMHGWHLPGGAELARSARAIDPMITASLNRPRHVLM